MGFAQAVRPALFNIDIYGFAANSSGRIMRADAQFAVPVPPELKFVFSPASRKASESSNLKPKQKTVAVKRNSFKRLHDGVKSD